MTIVVRPATADDRADWDAFVAARPEGDVLQLWSWGDVREPDGERPVRLIARDGDGRVRGLAGLLVRRTSFGRAVGYVPHGPLWDRDGADAGEACKAILAGIVDTAARERVIVAKLDPRAVDTSDSDALRRLLRGAGLRAAAHDLQAPTTRLVDLRDGADELWATWDAKARNHVRRAEREGVSVQVSKDADPRAIAEFHAALVETAGRSGFRTHPVEHFQRLAAALAPSTGWLLVLARHDGRVIAGMAMPRVADRAFYLYGASLRAPELRHLYGSYAAMAGAMRALAEGGARTLDMWGVVERDDPDADPAWAGFSDFKRLFGGTPLRHPGTFDLVVDRAWDTIRSLRERGLASARRLAPQRSGRDPA